MTFHVGQKVVCVDEKNYVYDLPDLSKPREGSIYTVRGFSRSGNLFLSGVAHWGAFFPRRFRPLVERKTDISIFTEILRKADKRKRVNA